MSSITGNQRKVRLTAQPKTAATTTQTFYRMDVLYVSTGEPLLTSSGDELLCTCLTTNAVVPILVANQRSTRLTAQEKPNG